MPPMDQFKRDIERLKEKSAEPLKSDNKTMNHNKDALKTSGTYYKINDVKKAKQIEDNIIKPPSKRMNSQFVKKISIAIISALIIGTVSGILILNVIVNPEESVGNEYESIASTKGISTDPNKALESELKRDYNAPSLQAYTLQLGVFSDAINAEQFVSSLKQSDLPLVIWPKDNLQYVLVGLAPDKETIRDLAEEILGESIDWFIKEWSNEPFQLKLTSDEIAWLELFVEQWKNTLQKNNPMDSIQENWQILKDNYPEKSETLKPINEQINKFIKNEIKNPFEIAEFLILTWLNYTNLPN